jgi:transposase
MSDLDRTKACKCLYTTVSVRIYMDYLNNWLDKTGLIDIIILTLQLRDSPMAKPPCSNSKQQSLHAQGVLHHRSEAVTDELFRQLDFFDPHDLLQVKYEMLRRVETDGYSVSAVAAAFGLSRPSFYEARAAWQHEGLAGLLPKKRGPHGGHKITDEVVMFLCSEHSKDASLTPPELVAQVEAAFGIQVHPRSIERALRRAEKKR